MATAERKRAPNRDQVIAKRTNVVQMRLEGHTLDAIAEANDLASAGGVRYHLDAWLAEQKPSAEQTEELRQQQAAQIDAMSVKLWPRLEWDDYLAVVDRIVKLMDRKARLMGLDLERNVNVNVLPDALQFAAFLGWDAPAGEVIEGQAAEITDGSEA